MERYGKYELLNRIGCGGMAEVFLARQASAGRFERIVVLKRIRAHLASKPQFVELFLEEARIAALLDHPNVIPIYDLGRVDQTYFISMPYVPGVTVRAAMKHMALQGARIPTPVSCEVVRQALAGLQYAHDRNDLDGRPLELVHRDISPSNLMINDHGRVILLDFGIATVADSVPVEVGGLQGKLPYMSPEQVCGEPLDRRSDLFSLGIVFFELLVGRRLFRRRTNEQVVEAIVREPIPLAHRVCADIPPRLGAVVQRLLQQRRERRHASAAQALSELDDAVSALQLAATPAEVQAHVETHFAKMLGEQRQMVQRARAGLVTAEQDLLRAMGAGSATVARFRHRRRIALAAILVLLALVGGVLGWLLVHRSRSAGEPLRLGVTPHLPEPVLRRALAPLTRYLEDQLDRPVELVVTDSYDQMQQALLAGRVDLADLTAYPFLLARRQDPNLRPLATATAETTVYKSLLVVGRQTRGELAQLRGRRVCYVDQTSTSGFLMARAMIRHQGHDPDTFFSSVQFSGDHHRALRDLLAGRCDVAAVSSVAYETAGLQQIASTRVVMVSRAMPAGVFCGSSKLSASTARALQRALLDLDIQRELGRKTLSEQLPISGFVAVDLSAFDELAREIERSARSAARNAVLIP